MKTQEAGLEVYELFSINCWEHCDLIWFDSWNFYDSFELKSLEISLNGSNQRTAMQLKNFSPQKWKYWLLEVSVSSNDIARLSYRENCKSFLFPRIFHSNARVQVEKVETFRTLKLLNREWKTFESLLLGFIARKSSLYTTKRLKYVCRKFSYEKVPLLLS